MEDLANVKKRVHKLMLSNRRVCNIGGVTDILTFDTNEIMLETEQGMLMVKGKDLHMKRLTLEKGEVDIEGTIDSLTYSELTGYGSKGESLLAKIFK